MLTVLLAVDGFQVAVQLIPIARACVSRSTAVQIIIGVVIV